MGSYFKVDHQQMDSEPSRSKASRFDIPDSVCRKQRKDALRGRTWLVRMGAVSAAIFRNSLSMPRHCCLLHITTSHGTVRHVVIGSEGTRPHKPLERHGNNWRCERNPNIVPLTARTRHEVGTHPRRYNTRRDWRGSEQMIRR